jgi:hypothetical protein
MARGLNVSSAPERQRERLATPAAEDLAHFRHLECRPAVRVQAQEAERAAAAIADPGNTPWNRAVPPGGHSELPDASGVADFGCWVYSSSSSCASCPGHRPCRAAARFNIVDEMIN